MKYVIGLDLGIASVGWAVLNQDLSRIEDLGVRAYSAAEDPKKRESLALPRRLARGARRRLRRRKGRMARIKALFISEGLVAEPDFSALFTTAQNVATPWQLRAEGLDRLLTGPELARALYHIAKHRGYKSNSKHAAQSTSPALDESAKEEQQVLQELIRNREMLRTSPYRTAGEMVFRDAAFAQRKRNASGDYSRSIDRLMLHDEIAALFEAQRNLDSSFASRSFETAYVDLFAWQMPFASGDDILKKVGACSFEPGEKRAPRNAYTAERFITLQKINQLAWLVGGERLSPTAEQRVLIVRKAHDLVEIKFSQLRKLLALPMEARFVGLTYLSRSKRTKVQPEAQSLVVDADTGLTEDFKCESAVFVRMTGYHAMKALASETEWQELQRNHEALDAIAEALTFYKTDDDIAERLREAGLPDALISRALSATGFKSVTHLSLLAMRRIVPHLEAGLIYSDACAAAGYDHSSPGVRIAKSLKLPVIDPDTIRNPIVLRTLTQARKVINAIIDRYGSPTRINIELARDLGKSVKDRREIERRIEENRREAQRFDEHFREHFHSLPTGEERLKWRLYREQGGKCAYSLQPLDLENRLREPGYCEIDHVLPYSRSFDDSISNKVLVRSAENQNKRNQTPHEHFGHDGARWSDYETWVNSAIKDPRKRQKLLTKDYKGVERDEWLPRNLVDTRYITREFATYLRTHLLFADESVKVPVVCLSGGITGMLRGVWGLAKVREENDLHHALDASVIASVTPRTVQLLTRFRQERECRIWNVGDTYVDPETGEVLDLKFQLPQPWPGFRKEVIARLSDNPVAETAALAMPGYAEPFAFAVKPVLVSRPPQRKVTGAIHKETIKGIRYEEGVRKATQRVPITSLKRADLDNLIDPHANKTFYAAIRERMDEFNGDAVKAFEKPLYKPGKNGTHGPAVRYVTLVANQPSGVPVRGGIADNANSSMVRVDVYTKDSQFFVVPVYIEDIMRKNLPRRAVTQRKEVSDWPFMDSSFDFKFSLYKFDFIRLKTVKEEIIGYYRDTHSRTAQVSVSPPNNIRENLIRPLGSRTALIFEKYEMTVLGDYHPIRSEAFHGLANDSYLESGETED